MRRFVFFFFKQKTAYEMRISDWSSDVCSSDLIAFDGDGDRLGLVDAQARILWGDQILLFLARDVLKRHPGATVIGDVKCSEALFDGIAAAGGRPLMWKTGPSVIKAKMKEGGAPRAGEMAADFRMRGGCYGHDEGPHAAA